MNDHGSDPAPDRVLRSSGRGPSGARMPWGSAAWVTVAEPLITVLVMPLLLFPTNRPAWTAIGLSLLVIFWILRWWSTGCPFPPTPFNAPLLLLCLMLPIAVWVSPALDVTIPKLTGLILGFAVFISTVNLVSNPFRLLLATAAFLILGLMMVAVALLGTSWKDSWPILAPVLDRFPQLLPSLPGTAATGISPNQLAGALLLFLPVALAAAEYRTSNPTTLRGQRAVRVIAALLVLVYGGVLVLTQSRSGWIGAVVGLSAMLWIRVPRLRPSMAIGAWGLATALTVIDPGLVFEQVLDGAASSASEIFGGVNTLGQRIEIWSRALYAAHNFPLTGLGLGAFRQLQPLLYPLFNVATGADIAHAHNMLLQVALDIGLPGLVAYVALLGSALWIGLRVALRTGSRFRWLGLGITGSLVAYCTYGLTEVVALGSKPGLAFWMLLGLNAALWQIERRDSQAVLMSGWSAQR